MPIYELFVDWAICVKSYLTIPGNADLTHRVPGAEGSGKSSIGIDIEFRSLEKLCFLAYFHWNREIHEEGSVLGLAKLVFFVIWSMRMHTRSKRTHRK